MGTEQSMTTASRIDNVVERLRQMRVILKSGDYDGADLMRAWCSMIDAADLLLHLKPVLEENERYREALRDIIGNANEAMPLGPFDQIDNDGEPYQSEAFQRALERGRKYLAALSQKGERCDQCGKQGGHHPACVYASIRSNPDGE
jgi:hypothetical protein